MTGQNSVKLGAAGLLASIEAVLDECIFEGH